MLAFENISSVCGQVYNIGGGADNSLSILRLLKMLEQKLGKSIQPFHSDWRPGDQKVYISDITKIEKALNWKPKINVNEGLSFLIGWTKDNKELLKSILG